MKKFIVIPFLIISLFLLNSGCSEEEDLGGFYVFTSIHEDTQNWNKMYNCWDQPDAAMAIAVDSAGNVYVAGIGAGIVTGGFDNDWWIKKFDGNGNEQNFGGSGLNICNQAGAAGSSCTNSGMDIVFDGNGMEDIITSIAVDPAGRVYVAGYGRNIAGATGQDWWIKKFNSNGEEYMDMIIDGNFGNDQCKSIAIDSEGNLYVAGFGTEIVDNIAPGSNNDIWIKKYDINGNEIDFSGSSKGVCSDGTNNPCSKSGKDIAIDHASNNDSANSIAIDPAGNVYVAGCGDNLVGATVKDWRIIKFDKNGNMLNFSGSSLGACGGGITPCSTNGNDLVFDGNIFLDDVINSIAVDPSGNLYAAGYGWNIFGGGSKEDWWIKKFDSNGNELDFGGSSLGACGGGTSPCSTNGKDMVYDSNGMQDIINKILVDPAGNIYVTGIMNDGIDDDWIIKKFDSNGNEDKEVWDIEFNGNNAAGGFSIAVDPAGSLYFTGYGKDILGATNHDWWIKKFYVEITVFTPYMF